MTITTIDLTSLNGSNGFRMDGETAYDDSGSSVSGAGDVNGDGFDDVIVGAIGAGPNGIDGGASYVVFGKPSDFDATLDLSSLDGSNGFRMDGVAKGDLSGSSVSGAGDVNGDGFDDLIVGSLGADPSGDVSGSSYVVFGKASGFDASLNMSSLDGSNGFRLDGARSYDRSGYSVSSAGDVNGDGFDDLLIGTAPNDVSFSSNYVVFGKNSGFDAALNLSSLDGTNGFRLHGGSGWSVSNAGDVNGDGFDDVIVGDPWAAPNGVYDAGSSYVVFGKSSGFDASLDLSSLNGTNGFRLDGVAADDSSGISVSTAGDVNGDGFDDVIVGAYHRVDPNGNLSGSSYVVFGNGSGFNAALNLSALNGTNGFRLDGVGEELVSTAGDVNGDGFDDVIVGDPNPSFGSSYVVFGKSSGFDATLNLSDLDSSNSLLLGGVWQIDRSPISVTNAGDINGDGFDDVIAGDPFASPNGSGSGSSYVLGSGPGSSYVLFGRSDFTDFNMVEGTPGDDILVGGGGNDTLSGNDGNDTIDGGRGNDILTGGLDNDILLAGFGEDQLLGNEGNDIFGFYAPGHFEIQDLNLAEDSIYLGVAQTGLGNIDEVNQMITAVNQREDGVEVEFGPDASIDLIGINFAEITAEMIGFA